MPGRRWRPRDFLPQGPRCRRRGRRCCGAGPHRQHLHGWSPPPCRRHEQLAHRPGQVQRIGQQQGGVLAAVRLMPRSRSLTDRGERPAASASSSCVRSASVRNCRSSPAKENEGGSATVPGSPRMRSATTCTNSTQPGPLPLFLAAHAHLGTKPPPPPTSMSPAAACRHASAAGASRLRTGPSRHRIHQGSRLRHDGNAVVTATTRPRAHWDVGSRAICRRHLDVAGSYGLSWRRAGAGSGYLTLTLGQAARSRSRAGRPALEETDGPDDNRWFADRTRLSPKALRLYDRLGLLPPAHTDPGQRLPLYSEDQVDSARLVALLRRLGMPLPVIADIAAKPPGERRRRSEVLVWRRVGHGGPPGPGLLYPGETHRSRHGKL